MDREEGDGMDRDKKHLIVGNDKRKLRTLQDHIIAGSGWPVAGIGSVPVSGTWPMDLIRSCGHRWRRP